jgi:uncharacterized RDD family membrane protein YckC
MVDYAQWTTDELNRLRVLLAAEGAGREETDAVAREIGRRESVADPRPAMVASAGTMDRAMPLAHALVAQPPETSSRRIGEMEHVGVAPRFFAFVIDGGVFFVLGFVLALLTGNTSSGGGLLFWALVSLVYYVSCETLLGGTLGKLALGLRVVDEKGDSIKWGAAVVRNLLRVVDGLFFYLIGAIAVWSSPARQRLGDRAAHTYVVRP